MIKDDIIDLSKHSLVVHSSNLPQGKGWSPMTWQIIEGKNKITNTLFEAVSAVVKAGPASVRLALFTELCVIQSKDGQPITAKSYIQLNTLF